MCDHTADREDPDACGCQVAVYADSGDLRAISHRPYLDIPAPARFSDRRFRILKDLHPNLTPRERQLLVAALPHDLGDTLTHLSKLGVLVTSPDPYVHWMCVHHHVRTAHPTNPDLQLLQAGCPHRALYPAPRPTFAVAAHRSVYKLYTGIYQSAELAHLTASNAHPTEPLRHHPIGFANCASSWRGPPPFPFPLLRQCSRETQVQLLGLSRWRIPGSPMSHSFV